MALNRYLNNYRRLNLVPVFFSYLKSKLLKVHLAVERPQLLGEPIVEGRRLPQRSRRLFTHRHFSIRRPSTTTTTTTTTTSTRGNRIGFAVVHKQRPWDPQLENGQRGCGSRWFFFSAICNSTMALLLAVSATFLTRPAPPTICLMGCVGCSCLRNNTII